LPPQNAATSLDWSVPSRFQRRVLDRQVWILPTSAIRVRGT
jgi:hypothetical protein